MIDTDICSYIMKQAPASLLLEMEQRAEQGNDMCISVITYSELRLGAERSQAREKYHSLIDEFSDRLDFISDWSTKEADVFAQLQARLYAAGTPIGSNDTMIAAHALSIGAVLVTNNMRHYSRVYDLRLENWTTNEG